MMRYFLLCLLLVLSTAAMASKIIVSNMLVNMMPGEHYTDIKVKNTGSDKAYVLVKVSKVLNPGMPNQTIDKLQDDPYKLGLIASPNKLIINPGQVRRVRLLNISTKMVNRDTVYHVFITPIDGTLVSSFKVNKKIALSGLEIVEAYQAKVFIRPRHPKPMLKVTRKKNMLTIVNVGNTNVLVNEISQCPHKICRKVVEDAKRLYAGNAWRVSLPYNMPIKVITTYINQKKIYNTQ